MKWRCQVSICKDSDLRTGFGLACKLAAGPWWLRVALGELGALGNSQDLKVPSGELPHRGGMEEKIKERSSDAGWCDD